MSGQATPLVSFVVPCYNSAPYMSRAIDSILEADRSCEILLINDGSTDETSAIAHEYATRYPQVRAVDQDNANWGGAVTHGLELARGTYFKVVDSDDYLEPMALHQVLDALARAREAGDMPDLLITNYMYDHLPTNTQRVMHYRGYFPEDRVFGWDEVGRQDFDRFLMIHACWYATATLRASGVLLPEKMSYMDSILLLHPMPYVRKLYYLDIEPYFYVIGREGQSVDVEVIRKHIDEQLFATMLAIEDTDYGELYERIPQCATLMMGYMMCMMSVSTLNLFQIGTPEALAKNDKLWDILKESNPVLYQKIRRTWVGLVNRKTPLGRYLAVHGYDIVKRIYKLA